MVDDLTRRRLTPADQCAHADGTQKQPDQRNGADEPITRHDGALTHGAARAGA